MALRNSRRTRPQRGRALRGPRTRDKTIRKQAPPRQDSRTGTEWEPIDLSPEEIARLAMQGPPKKDWRYLKNQ